ncbi:MAG TPA: class I SAM-dependent methyltransferase [Solirubrobacteraceae bacterium]|nr:class I SAM-dependent methyltransferase [Solirubrobacteraceae bacterium]
MPGTDSAAGVRTAEAGAADGYFDHVRPELASLVPEHARRIVDFGCGRGALGAHLKERQGAEVLGVELFPDAAAVAAERLDDVVRADLDVLDDLPLEEGSVDVAIFGDVLEHLRDPHRLLRVARRYLKPFGRIVCSIPNVKHFSVVVPLLVADRFEYTDAGLLDRTHVHLFTLEEIDAMLRETGFEAVSLGATNVGALPERYRALAELAGRLGADPRETAARLEAYQYLVVATPATAVGTGGGIASER